MLAHITGSVNEDLLRRIEYLIEENRVLRNGLGSSPERRRNPTWSEFIRRHRDVL